MNFSGGHSSDFQEQDKPPVITDPDVQEQILSHDPRIVKPETPDDPLHEEPQPDDNQKGVRVKQVRKKLKGKGTTKPQSLSKTRKIGPRTPDTDDLKSSGGIDRLP